MPLLEVEGVHTGAEFLASTKVARAGGTVSKRISLFQGARVALVFASVWYPIGASAQIPIFTAVFPTLAKSLRSKLSTVLGRLSDPRQVTDTFRDPLDGGSKNVSVSTESAFNFAGVKRSALNPSTSVVLILCGSQSSQSMAFWTRARPTARTLCHSSFSASI